MCNACLLLLSFFPRFIYSYHVWTRTENIKWLLAGPKGLCINSSVTSSAAIYWRWNNLQKFRKFEKEHSICHPGLFRHQKTACRNVTKRWSLQYVYWFPCLRTSKQTKTSKRRYRWQIYRVYSAFILDLKKITVKMLEKTLCCVMLCFVSKKLGDRKEVYLKRLESIGLINWPELVQGEI